jgi:hypothetical protein
MNCVPEKFAISRLVKAWRSGSLKRNSEYQRGAAWKPNQMQGLVDSAFRAYPLPPIFLHEITEEGLTGTQAVRYEVVDGQQRIRSFSEFYDDAYPLLKPDDKQLRLPDSLRILSAPWGGRLYSQLDAKQKSYLDAFELNCYVVKEVSNPDEIRDLFIRLQSGTALSRQQIRDAWPGNLGPFIEGLAGKLSKQPSAELFDLIDRRSDRGDEDFDKFTVDRQICAQLFTLYMSRLADRLAIPSIGADDLDRTYHANTKFDANGPTASGFRLALARTASIIRSANELSGQRGRGKNKHKKLDIIATFFLVQDFSTNPNFKWSPIIEKQVGTYIVENSSPNKQGKSTSGRAIGDYYELWRLRLPEKLGVHLDPKRLFDPEQKQQIYEKTEGKCSTCQKQVDVGEAEYDHYPHAHYLGGRTEVENGRLVCKTCHPRGRPLY